MKKYFLPLIIIASILVSCEKTKEEKIQEMIESKLEQTMNNPDSYEFVSMSPIDSIMSKFEDEKDAIFIDLDISRLKSKNKVLYAKADAKYTYSTKERLAFLDSVKINLKEINSLLEKYESKNKSYVPHTTGYFTIFSFRGQNSFGAIVLNSYKVIFDTELQEIKEMKLLEK